MSHSNRKSVLEIFILLLALYWCCQAQTSSPTTGTCQAEVYVNSTYPAPEFMIYNQIMINNTGTCAIVQVLVNVTLPPSAPAPFQYSNYSAATGELTGFASPIQPGQVAEGGLIVMRSILTPAVSLFSVECSCNEERSLLVPTYPIVQLAAGSNESWIGLKFRGVRARDVELRDSSSSVWHVMEKGKWGEYYLHSSSTPLVLPLSLRFVNDDDNQHVQLDDVIKSLSSVFINTKPIENQI